MRHKLLDAVGDLALGRRRSRGRFVGHRSGHALNNRVLRALFADPRQLAPGRRPTGSAGCAKRLDANSRFARGARVL